LATVFRRCTIYWLEVPDLLLGVLPRVTTHRAELAAVLRLYRDDFSSALLRSTPFHVFGLFTQYRDVARLAGDPAEADAWEQILERHATVLADRKRVTAFMIWNH